MSADPFVVVFYLQSIFDAMTVYTCQCVMAGSETFMRPKIEATYKSVLSDLLGKYRITQAELARKTGIRPATICDIYNEMCDRINLEHLDRICEVLGCDVADILEYQPNKIKKTGTNLILEQNGNRKKNN